MPPTNTPAPASPRLPSIIVAGPDGRSLIDPKRKGERAAWLRMNDYPLSIAPGLMAPSAFYVPSSGAGDFQADTLVALGNVPFTCELKALVRNGGAYDLQNAPIHHNLMFGLADDPFELAEPLLLEAGQALQLRATSLGSSATLALRAALGGRFFSDEMVPEERRRAVESATIEAKGTRPYWLTLDKTSFSLTALQSRGEYLMSMPNNYYLVIERPPLCESTGPFQVELSDRNDGRSLTPDGPLDSQIMCSRGNGRDAGLFGGLVFNPGQTIKAQFTDVSGAANVGYFTLHGRLVPCR